MFGGRVVELSVPPSPPTIFITGIVSLRPCPLDSHTLRVNIFKYSKTGGRVARESGGRGAVVQRPCLAAVFSFAFFFLADLNFYCENLFTP